ncbi:MAG: hypothetical protein ACYDD2_11180 [Candidatus Acidiferrales bacterium]
MHKSEREKVKWTDITMMGATVIIAFWAGLQWWEMHGTGEQTGQLIAAANIEATAATQNVTAANRIARSSETNASAATTFASSAANINTGISRAVEQLKASAQNAERSIRAAQGEMRLEQRAWVGPEKFEILGNADDWSSVTVGLTIKNTGLTPAIRMSVFMWPMITDRPFPHTPPEPEVSDPFTGYGPLLPNSTQGGVWEFPLDKTKNSPYGSPAVARGDSFLYIYGKIKYYDVFDRQHTTHFCGMMQRFFNFTPVKPLLKTCKEYNDAD